MGAQLDRRRRWEADDRGLALLDAAGPFEHRSFREILVDVEGWRDVSYAACLPDGTTAAIALLARHGVGVSVPWGYGAVRASRPLDPVEAGRFVQSARRHHGLLRVVVQEIVEPTLTPARTVTTTHVVRLDPERPPRSVYASSTRKRINRTRREGLVVERTTDPTAFLRLYAEASQGWGSDRYPDAAITAITAAGLGRIYEVRLEGEVVTAGLVLLGAEHWMYWLLSSSPKGHEWRGSYGAQNALLEDAWGAGVPWVNLGASEVAGRPLPGVALFKERFGAVPVPFTRASQAVPGVEVLLHAGRPARRVVSALRHGRPGRDPTRPARPKPTTPPGS